MHGRRVVVGALASWVGVQVAACNCTTLVVGEEQFDSTATIKSHADGTAVRAGTPLELWGTIVADPQREPILGTWSLDDTLQEGCTELVPTSVNDEGPVVRCTVAMPEADVRIGLLGVLTDHPLYRHQHEITLRASKGEPPEATIDAPAVGDVLYSDHTVVLAGTVTDAEDEPSSLHVAWRSSLDGDLDLDPTPDADGETSGGVLLSEGEHLLKLAVTDADGNTVSDEILIAVGPSNTAPTCSIEAPATGTTVPAGNMVTFEGKPQLNPSRAAPTFV